MGKADTKKSPKIGTGSQKRNWRNAALLLFIAAVTALIVAGIVFLQDQPLAEAESQLADGRPQQAIELVNKYLEDHPEDGRALAIKARATLAVGNSADAILLFRRAGVATQQDTHAFARALLDQGQWSEALPVLERVLEFDPDDADALYEISVCRTRLGRFSDALKSAERFAKLPGYENRGYLLLGNLHLDMNNRFQAAEAWKKVLELSPDATGLQVKPDEFLLAYGGLLAESGRPREALPLLEKSKASRATAEVHAQLGNVLSQLDEPQRARTEWLAAVELDELNVEAREALADEALRRGAAQEALQWLLPLAMKELVRSSTAYQVQRAHTMLGEEKVAEVWRTKTERMRKREQLHAMINHMLIESPQSYWAQVVRAYRFAEEGNWPQAAVLLQPLVSESADEPFVQKLAQAIEQRGPLPPLEQLPIKTN